MPWNSEVRIIITAFEITQRMFLQAGLHLMLSFTSATINRYYCGFYYQGITATIPSGGIDFVNVSRLHRRPSALAHLGAQHASALPGAGASRAWSLSRVSRRHVKVPAIARRYEHAEPGNNTYLACQLSVGGKRTAAKFPGNTKKVLRSLPKSSTVKSEKRFSKPGPKTF
jgi:hypothetical protein